MSKGRIGNADYQRLTQSIKKTASRDLKDLVRKGVFAKFGTTGRGTYYGLSPQRGKGDIKGTKGTSKTRPGPIRKPHASIPHNPLIADPLFLVRYVEKAGTGILDAISLCRQAGLPEPEFRQDAAQFVMTLWRGWLTDKMLAKMDLSERQKLAVMQLKVSGRISNSEYQRLYGVTKPTASRDLDDLRRKGMLKKVGTTGKGTYYTLVRKGLTKGSSSTARGVFSRRLRPRHC